MQLLFRLPFLLLETVLRQGVAGLSAVARLLRGEDDDATVTPMPSSPPETAPRAYRGTTDRPEPPTAEEAIQRRFDREAAARETAPAPERSEAPAPRSVPNGAPRHVDREATVVESVGPAEDVHGTITVDAPWDGYDDMPASAIVARLRDADDATRAVVRLYEQMHKKRTTVVRATG